MKSGEHPTSLGLKLYELLIVAFYAVIYVYLRFFTTTEPLILSIMGFILALWAILKPTEWAVEGLSMLAEKLGIGTYAAGNLGGLTANLPELILAILLILKGEAEVAILTVLVVAGANTLLFGVITVRSSIKAGGEVKVPVTTLRYESELMMVVFVTSMFLFVYNSAEVILNPAKLDHGLRIPILFSVGTVLIYLAFITFIIKDKSINPVHTEEDKEKIRNDPGMKWSNIIKFLIFGTVGIILAGELLAFGAELLIEEATHTGVGMGEPHIALIVGFLGSLPEWAVAFKAGDDIELVFGSVLSSISATLLFMIGLVSIFLTIIGTQFTLDPFAIVQMVLSGCILLFVNLLMKDDLKLDAFEGICIIIIQIIGFDVLISV